MVHLIVGLIAFVAIFGGAIVGLVAAQRLPGHHLDNRTQSAVTVSVAVIGTLAALVLGLMITTANGNFSARTDEVRELSLQLIRMDRNLRRYGPETEDIRVKLRLWGETKIRELFPEKGQTRASNEETISLLESVQDGVLALTPQTEKQKYLRTLCATLSSTMIQARWGLQQRSGHSTPTAFLILLIFWLTIVFASFGLFAPANSTSVIALFLCSMAVAGGIYLIQELDNPTSGFIQTPPDSMRKAVQEINR